MNFMLDDLDLESIHRSAILKNVNQQIKKTRKWQQNVEKELRKELCQ